MALFSKETHKEIEERFYWDKSASVSDNLLRLFVSYATFGAILYFVLKIIREF